MISIWCNERHSIILLVLFFCFKSEANKFFVKLIYSSLIFHEFFLPLNCKQCHQILAHPLSYCWRICQNSTAEGGIFFWRNCFIPVFHNNFVKYKTKFQFHEFFFDLPIHIWHTTSIFILLVLDGMIILYVTKHFFSWNHTNSGICVFSRNFW